MTRPTHGLVVPQEEFEPGPATDSSLALVRDTVLLLDDVEDTLRELGRVVIVRRYVSRVAPLLAKVREKRDALAQVVPAGEEG